MVDGETVDIRSPQHAHDLGFAFLHQELNLVAKSDALENMSLGLVGRNAIGLADRRPTFAKARGIAKDIRFEFPLDRPVGELPVAQQSAERPGHGLSRGPRRRASGAPAARPASWPSASTCAR